MNDIEKLASENGSVQVISEFQKFLSKWRNVDDNPQLFMDMMTGKPAIEGEADDRPVLQLFGDVDSLLETAKAYIFQEEMAAQMAMEYEDSSWTREEAYVIGQCLSSLCDGTVPVHLEPESCKPGINIFLREDHLCFEIKFGGVGHFRIPCIEVEGFVPADMTPDRVFDSEIEKQVYLLIKKAIEDGEIVTVDVLTQPKINLNISERVEWPDLALVKV